MLINVVHINNERRQLFNLSFDIKLQTLVEHRITSIVDAPSLHWGFPQSLIGLPVVEKAHDGITRSVLIGRW